TVEKCRFVDDVLSEIESEEIADWDFDAWFTVSIPVHPDDDFFEMIHSLRGNGKPDMRNHAWPFRLEQILRSARMDRPAVRIASSAVIAGLLERPVILSADIGRQEAGGTFGATALRL